MIIGTTLLTVSALITYVARIHARLYPHVTLGLDDAAITIAMVRSYILI